MKGDSISWLLGAEDPSVRYNALVDIVGVRHDSKEAAAARDAILQQTSVRRIMNAQVGEGYWAPEKTCYQPKFTSTVWPLILLGEMGVAPQGWIKTACERFLDLHQMENGAFSCPSRLQAERGKRYRMLEEPCLTGNMIRTLTVFGYGDDKRVLRAIEWMPQHQLEDGGWNCDHPAKKVQHSSFMSTIEPLWAYSEIPRAKWTRKMKRSVGRAVEFMLMHHLYKSDHHDWRPSVLFGEEDGTKFHFPMYYYYDALHGLRVLVKLGYGDDERVRDAVHLILSKMTPEGKWLLEGDWFRERKLTASSPSWLRERKTIVNVETLMKPSKWVTLNCYRALLGTGDLEIPKRYER